MKAVRQLKGGDDTQSMFVVRKFSFLNFGFFKF